MRLKVSVIIGKNQSRLLSVDDSSSNQDVPGFELIAMAYNFYSELVHPNLGSNPLLIGILNDKVQVESPHKPMH